MRKLKYITTILTFSMIAGVTNPVSVFAQASSPASMLSRFLNLGPQTTGENVDNSEQDDQTQEESPEPSNSPQPSATASPAPSVSPAPTDSPQPSVNPEPSSVPSPSPVPSTTPQPSPTVSPTPSPSPSPQPTPSPAVIGDVDDGDPPSSDIGGSTTENEEKLDEEMSVPRQDEQQLEPRVDVYEEVSNTSHNILPAARDAVLRPLSVIVPEAANGFVPSSQYNYSNQVPEEVNTALSLIGVNSLLLAGLIAKSESLIKLLPFSGALFNR